MSENEIQHNPNSLVDRLSKEQIEAILEALPLAFFFVDENDCLQYYNKGEIHFDYFKASVGKDLIACHKPESRPRTKKMLDDFKNGLKDEDEFWMDGMKVKLLNRFFAVRDKSNRYLGCIETALNFTAMEKLAESKKDAYRRVMTKDELKKL